MGIETAGRDPNYTTTVMGISLGSPHVPTQIYVDEVTHRLLVNATITGGSGDGSILDGTTSSIKATVFAYPDANPLAVRLTDTNGDYVVAATSTKQDTGNTSLSSIDGKVPALGQALAAGSTPVVLPVAQITTLTPPAAITGFALEAGNLATIAGSITGAKAQINVSQINGATPLMGAGNTGAGSPRVTIASDQAVIPISDNSGSLTVDAPVGTPVFATITPNTTGGWSTFLATSSDGATALTNSAQVIKGSAGTFGGYYIYNPNTVAIYVHIYNVAAASVTVGTTNPQNTFCIPPTSAANLELTNGINYGTAMSASATTTGGGNSAPTTALEANFWFK